MAFDGRSLDTITEADLQDLVSNGVPEGRDLDYKQELPGKSNDEKRSSFMTCPHSPTP